MNSNHTRTGSRISVIASAVLLCACGGGGGSSAGNTAPSAVAGTVATGSPIPNAKVTATDINGKTASATADANGNYALTVSGLTAPVLLTAVDPTGQHDPLVSVIGAIPASGQPATINVTTLTTAIGALITASGNPLDLLTPTNLAADAVPGNLTKASSTLNATLASILTANGLSPASFDAISTPFTANQSGADAAIDAVQLIQNGTGTYLVSSGSASSGLLLNNATTAPPTPLAVPPVAANYLNFMQGLLQSCLATSVARRSSAAACIAAFDASYKDNGYTSFADYVPNLQLATSVGATVGVPQTVEFFKDASQTQYALVRIPYTLTDGTPGSVVTTVKQLSSPVTLPDGSKQSWDIYGNQLKYDARTESRVTLRTFLDTFANSTGSSDVSHYDAGMSFIFNPAGPNAGSVNAIQVTGPGLPATGLFLLKSSACGTANSLAIPGTKPATLPPASSTTVTSDTNEYRWSWQTVAGAATSFAPPLKYFWDAAQVDPSTVPFYPSYTFTLFDAGGNQLDQFQVTSATPVVSASLGATAQWNTLGSDVVSNFLTPGGSSAGAQATAAIDWTVNPVAPSLLGVAVYSLGLSGPGVDGFTSVHGSATSATVTAGVDSSGAQTCTGAQFLALTDGTYRIVQLRTKNQNGVRFFQNTTYRSGATAPNAS